MLTTIRVATATDLDAACQFYQSVCEHQSADAYAPGWKWGVYPDRTKLANAVKRGQLIIGLAEKTVVAAGLLTVGDDASYQTVPWQFQPATDHDIAVLHLYAVHPEYRGHGLASEMLQGILAQARTAGQTVVHLDVRKGNLPAEKLYLRNGFKAIEDRQLNYANVGPTWARLCECPLV